MFKAIVVLRSIGVICAAMFLVASASAQTPAAGHDDHQQPTGAQPADQSQHAMEMQSQFPPREGSGTAWLPDETPMYALHRPAGAWELMWHANVFLQFLSESSERVVDAGGSINWAMLMARRPIGPAQVSLLGMFSLEPWTVRGCGYPDLLATGEVCNGEAIHDRQHPHDLLMELAAAYERPIRGSLRWQLYAGLAGEPALGPVGYPHRPSALPNPLAPISHHWLDSTHISFGVVTTGIHGNRWKAEGSAFNGREPNDERADLDLAALDSFSGRVWYLPTPHLALQLSAGHLEEAEAGHDGEGRVDVDRLTASATYHRADAGSAWATTVAWGRNAEAGESTDAVMAETSLTLNDQDTWFGRVEVAGKTAHDLDVELGAATDEVFTVAKMQAGYTRHLGAWHGWRPGFGSEISLGIVPNRLESAYGRRANVGLGVFITLRPAAMQMAGMATAGHEHAAAPEHEHPAAEPEPSKTPMPAKPAAPSPPPGAADKEPRLPVLPAERIIDPACADKIDLQRAPRAAYQGKVYYFCSEADRAEFLKDPDAYLKKRPQL